MPLFLVLHKKTESPMGAIRILTQIVKFLRWHYPLQVHGSKLNLPLSLRGKLPLFF